MLQTNTIPVDKRPRAFDVIERNAVAQNRLIEDLLDMSRITAGKVRLDPAPIPVATVLREAVDGVKPTADAKGLALLVEIDPFAGTVSADTARLLQVFSNLLTNAVKFTPGGGHVRVTLRSGDGATIGGIAFRAAGQPLGQALLKAVGTPLHVAGTLCIDRWGGAERVELRIIDAAVPV
jgi:signal transduction histidine kinase